MAANLSSIICLPCKACNKICLGVGDMCRSPFFLYVTVTTCLNAPPVIYSLISLLEHQEKDNSNCNGKIWLIINLIFCIINISASWYLYCKIRHSFGDEDNEFSNRRTAFSRASYILCYDPIITLYLLILIAYFIWQCIGISWILSCSDDNAIKNPFGSSLGFGWAFLCIGPCSFCCSLCCVGCDGTDYGQKQGGVPQVTQPTSVYVPEQSAVTGLSSPIKKESYQNQQPSPVDNAYNEIPVAIAVPLPPPSFTKKGDEQEV